MADDDDTLGIRTRTALSEGPNGTAVRPSLGGRGGRRGSTDDWRARLLDRRVIATIVLAVIVLACEFPLGTYLSSTEPYAGVNETLDCQKDVTLGLVATSTGASVAVSAIPDDVGTPIAEQLADLSGKLMAVLAIIYFEKFLLTTLGFVAMRVFVPIGLGLFIARLWMPSAWGSRKVMLSWGTKLVVVGIALVTLVPVSVWLTDRINDQYQTSLQAEQTSQEASDASAAAAEQGDGSSQDQSILEWLGSSIKAGVDALASGAEDAANLVGEQLNKLIDAVAVTIVTSCLVPLVVLLIYLWLIKLFTGADLTGFVSKAGSAAGASVRQAGSVTHDASRRRHGSTNDD